MRKKQPVINTLILEDADLADIRSGEYPKRFEIVVDRHAKDPTKVLVTRTCDNMSGFELYGLLQVILRAVEMQITFPEI